MKTWKDILAQWENGNYFTYPKKIKNRFHWNTSALNNNNDCIFKESYKENDELPSKQDIKSFEDYIKESTNKYVTHFLNMSGDTILIIPMPRKGKNFATLKDFSDNASKLQKRYFWIKVAEIAKEEINKGKKIYISVHGLGVPYMHVRISEEPKYYFDKNLI